MSLAHIGVPELEARAAHERALARETEDGSLDYEETPVTSLVTPEAVASAEGTSVASTTQGEAAVRAHQAVRKFLEVSDRRDRVAKTGPESRFPRVAKVVDTILDGFVKVFEIPANALTKTPPRQDHDDDRHTFSR